MVSIVRFLFGMSLDRIIIIYNYYKIDWFISDERTIIKLKTSKDSNYSFKIRPTFSIKTNLITIRLYNTLLCIKKKKKIDQ